MCPDTAVLMASLNTGYEMALTLSADGSSGNSQRHCLSNDRVTVHREHGGLRELPDKGLTLGGKGVNEGVLKQNSTTISRLYISNRVQMELATNA